MKKIVIMAAALMASLPLAYSQDGDKVSVKVYGFVRNYLTFDSRKTYTVVAGDCLWTISQRIYGTGTKWGELWANNTDIIANPRLIFPGQVIKIP